MGQDIKQDGVQEDNPLNLTSGEILIILRRRDGLTQDGMAKKIRVNLSQYKRMEYDMLDAPKMEYGQLTTPEHCYILRRRAGRQHSQLKIAKALKVCRWWVNQMERGKIPCEPLAAYWGI